MFCPSPDRPAHFGPGTGLTEWIECRNRSRLILIVQFQVNLENTDDDAQFVMISEESWIDSG